MADPALDTIDPTKADAKPPITALVPSGGSTTLDKLLPSKEETEGYAKITRDQVAANETARREVEQRGESFREFAIKQYNATGVDPAKFQKWDAQQEWDKRQTQPLEAFGSLGSVFGMIASAFTHAPMENALNASAAAMNAIHAGDRDSYERAHEAWKQNIDLAMKRQQMEREHYLDAFKLFDTDMRLGEAKMRDVASRFGDQKTLWMVDHGMIPELFQMHADRANMISQATKAANEVTTDYLRRNAYEGELKSISQIADPTERSRAMLESWNRVQGLDIKPNDPQAQVWGRFMAETRKDKGREPTADEMTEQLRKIEEARKPRTTHTSLTSSDAQELERRAAEYFKTGKAPTKEKAYDMARSEITQAAAKPVTATAAAKATEAKTQRKHVVDDYLTNVDEAITMIAGMRGQGGPQVGSAAAATRAYQNVTGQQKTVEFEGKQLPANVVDLQRKLADLKAHYSEVFAKKGQTRSAELHELDTIIPGEITGFNLSLTKGLSLPNMTRLNTVENALKDLRSRIQKRYDDLVESGGTPEPGGAPADNLRALSDEELRQRILEALTPPTPAAP